MSCANTSARRTFTGFRVYGSGFGFSSTLSPKRALSLYVSISLSRSPSRPPSPTRHPGQVYDGLRTVNLAGLRANTSAQVFGVLGIGSQVSGIGVSGIGFRVSEFQVSGIGLRVSSFAIRVAREHVRAPHLVSGILSQTQ